MISQLATLSTLKTCKVKLTKMYSKKKLGDCSFDARDDRDMRDFVVRVTNGMNQSMKERTCSMSNKVQNFNLQFGILYVHVHMGCTLHTSSYINPKVQQQNRGLRIPHPHKDRRHPSQIW